MFGEEWQAALETLLVQPHYRLALLIRPAGNDHSGLPGSWTSDYLAHHPNSLAWLRLCVADNLPRTFHLHLINALLELCSSSFEEPPGEIISNRPVYQFQEAMIALTNDVMDFFRDPFIVILDDYQVINNPEVHQAICRMLDYPLPVLRLVIITQCEPALPIARLRARRQLLEVFGEKDRQQRS